MKRGTGLSIVTVVLVLLVVSATQSQTRRVSGSASGRTSGGGSGSASGGGGGTTGVGPTTPDEFARNMAEQQRDFQQRMEEMQRQAEESRNSAIRQALHATDEQWRQLKPKLDRIERLKTEAHVAVDLGSFGAPAGFQGSGMMFGSTWGFGSDSQSPGNVQTKTWSWGTPTRKSPMEMTPGEVLCDDLARLLQDPAAPASQVAEKVESLRKLRAQAQADLAKARTELRAQATPQQQPVLVAMGYLD